MNKITEQKLRRKVRGIIESVLNEGEGDRKVAANIKTACTNYIAGSLSYDAFKSKVTSLVKQLS